MYQFLQLFVFWYPITMALFWILGSIFYYFRNERKEQNLDDEEPMISILIPAYNEGDNIIHIVERMSKLNYSNYEMIIINDGSNDQSPHIEKKLLDYYSNVRFIDLKENCGKANALSLGLLAAKGEFLMCVDGDSFLDEDCLKHMIKHFTASNNGEKVGAVTGNPRVRNRTTLLSKIQLTEYASIISLIKRAQRTYGQVMTVSGVCVMYRKQALVDCGMWDRDMVTEDIAVTWKLERAGWSVRYESKAMCYMLVPETIKGIVKQRQRWAKGGQEVIGRHASIFLHWKNHRLWPVYMEQILSYAWVILWVVMTIGEIIDPHISAYWKAQYIALVCMFQFVFALLLDRRYDKHLMRNFFPAAWYPFLYWLVNNFVALSTLPSSIFKRNQRLATWTSPDRGFVEEEPDITNIEYHIERVQETSVPTIVTQDRSWSRKTIEFLISLLIWVWMLIYPVYCIYGAIQLFMGNVPMTFGIYNTQVLYDTLEMLQITGVIVLVEFVFLIVWTFYNQKLKRQSDLDMPDSVSVTQLMSAFELSEHEVKSFQKAKYIYLEKNIVPENMGHGA